MASKTELLQFFKVFVLAAGLVKKIVCFIPQIRTTKAIRTTLAGVKEKGINATLAILDERRPVTTVGIHYLITQFKVAASEHIH
jgi:hypothetical protein